MTKIYCDKCKKQIIDPKNYLQHGYSDYHLTCWNPEWKPLTQTS